MSSILIVKIHKGWFCLRIEDRERQFQDYNQCLVRLFQKSNSAKYYEVRSFLKQTDCREEIDITELKWIRKDHSLSKYHKMGLY